MLSFPCPWCDREVVVADWPDAAAHVRCDDCATVVDLAHHAVSEPADRLPLAA